MKIVYIHGNGASSDSFNFLRSEIGGDSICLEYDSADGFAANLGPMVELLQDESEIFFVAHSLGGIYALHLADILKNRVVGAVTMATPFGGCHSALVINFALACQMKPPLQLCRDVHPGAEPISKGFNVQLDCPWTAIVTTKGHSTLMSAANDGVVTKMSMLDRVGAKFIEVAATHYEVLLSYHSVAIIKAALAEVEELAEAA